MIASHIQSELLQAVLAGRRTYEPIVGAFDGAVSGTPEEVSAWLRVILCYLIAPRVAAFNPADYRHHNIDQNFQIELEHAGSLPTFITMTNHGDRRVVRLDWSDRKLTFAPSGPGDVIRVVVLRTTDARSDLIHWLTWAVADFFGEEDE